MLSNLFSPNPILIPVLVLVLWSLVMAVWMLFARMRAMNAAGMEPQAGARAIDLGARLPADAQTKADNYNHLMEQPTIFYALALTLAIAGMGTGLNLTCAWIYVGARIIHSLIQSTVNIVILRFSVFMIATIALAVMAINAAMKMM